ncbi:sensor histidine kinase [Roseateles chitosanitabidus]|uniref:sensor histidine kinase n=1 Tax=Roseateles chitosanitabidus TaxID=65048 RepID=UPI0008344E11|nr:sensor histidine kinase [Roseateles chitosanitabidus]MBO9687870.1 hypothetical protein [Roseateles chitosanitabidus]
MAQTLVTDAGDPGDAAHERVPADRPPPWSPTSLVALIRPTLLLLGLVAAALLGLWAMERHGGRVSAVSEVTGFEMREATPGDPRAPRMTGRLIQSNARLTLPAFIRTDGDRTLHTLRYQIDLGPFITPDDIHDPVRDGDGLRPSKSLVITQSINGASVWLNGVWLDGYAQSTPDARFMWFRPLVAELPRKLLRRDGPNIVTVEVSSWEPYFTLAPIYVGRSEEAGYVAETIDFLGVALAHASKAFCFLAGLFMIGVWLANRHDKVFALLGAAALTWALACTLSLWVYMPAAWRTLWLWTFYLSAGGLNVLLVQFILRYIDRPLTRRALVALFVVSAVAATIWPFAGQLLEWNLDMFWIWALLPFQAWAVAQLALHVWRTRSGDGLLLLVTVLLAGLLILHDYNVLMQLIPWPAHDGPWNLTRLLTAPIYLTHLALPPLLIVMARVHLAKYRVSVEHVREANRILAESLRRREMELAVSYDRQRDLERREAAQDERERIYNVLHDGIGSRLITTIFSLREGRVEPQQLERNLLGMLQGVRDVISETDTTEHREIQDILFDYCMNLDSMLSAPDFQVEYDIAGGGEFVLLGERSKDLLRIVEESVANTLKYARASRLRISLTQEDTSLTLTVSDNGDAAANLASGIRPAFGTSTGHGLTNMRERAQAMGASFRFERGDHGALTTVVLPLAPAPGTFSPRSAAS